MDGGGEVGKKYSGSDEVVVWGAGFLVYFANRLLDLLLVTHEDLSTIVYNCCFSEC